jgi:RNA polymerase sigma-70 factor (ECF subfamily)
MTTHNPRLLYEDWVRTLAPELYRFAYRISGNRQVAEDLVQETFAEAWRSMDKQREPEKARAWLYQILRYRFSHYVRDRGHRIQAGPLHDGIDAAQRARPTLDALAEREQLQLALDQLAPEIRETFLMVFMQGYKCREAAQELRVPMGTILSRLSRARASLRKTLESRQLQQGGQQVL